MKTTLKTLSIAAVMSLAAPFGMMGTAFAATATWQGGTDGLASTSANWAGGYIPVAGDSVAFPASATTHVIDFDGAHTLGSPNTIELVDMLFNGDHTTSSSKSYRITSENTFELSGDILATMTGNGGDHSIDASLILTGDSVFRTTGSNTLSVGGDESTIDIGSNTLTLDAQGGSIALFGELVGSGTVVQSGEGSVSMWATPATGSSLTTSVVDGELIVVGQTGNITIDGGILKGNGTVGSITLNSGEVAPGTSPGILSSGNIAFTGGTHRVELGGTADGSFDKLNVTGTVDLGSGTALAVELFGGYEPAENDSFMIIENDGTDEVVGEFDGWADGQSVTLNGVSYQVNYNAGDGNDVVLLVLGEEATAPDTGAGQLLVQAFMPIVAAIAAAAVLAGAVRLQRKNRS